MKKIICLVFGLCWFSASYAGELTTGAEIIKIGNSANGGGDFFITVKNGTGPCGHHIIFPEAEAPSAQYHSRAYALALTAFTSGNTKVRVFNFKNESCTEASYIEMSK